MLKMRLASFPVRKAKSVWLWCTDPLGKGRERGGGAPAPGQLLAAPFGAGGITGCLPPAPTHSTVMILVWLFLELSLFILAMLSGVWNFSALMKSTGLDTSGYSVFSRGNIQASRATAHLHGTDTRRWPRAAPGPPAPREHPRSRSPEAGLLHQGQHGGYTPKRMPHDGHFGQINAVLQKKR